MKLPATAAGIEVIEHLAEEGIPICATINVSVAQAIAVAEAYARGKEKALPTASSRLFASWCSRWAVWTTTCRDVAQI